MQNNSNNRVSTASKYYKSWLAKFQLKALQRSAAKTGSGLQQRPYLGPISPSHCHHSLAYLFGYTHFKQTIYQSENNNLGCQYLFMFLLFFIDNRLGDFCCWYYNISQYIDAGRWLWKAIFLPVNCDTLNECKIDLVSVFKQSQSVFPSTENWIFHLW